MGMDELMATIRNTRNELARALEWIEADEAMSTDFPEEWEELVARLKSVIASADSVLGREPGHG